MKNVRITGQTEVFVEPIPVPLRYPLWAIKYVSGLDGAVHTQPGHWLVRWEPTPENISFGFGKERTMYYVDEASAQSVSDVLRKDMEIETEVVKIG